MQLKIDLKPYRAHLDAGNTVLTPGLRLARYVSAAWANERLANTAVIQVPAVYPVDAWLEDQWTHACEQGKLAPGRLLTRLEERLLWESVVRNDLQRSPLFTLLNATSAADAAMRSRQQWLLHTGRPIQARDRPLFLQEPDCERFLQWNSVFEQHLEEHGLLTRPDAYLQLKGVLPKASVTVFLTHPDSVPPLTRRVLEGLAHVTADARIEPDAANPPDALEFPDPATELKAVASWAAERHAQSAGTTGVVLLDAQRDRSELEYRLREAFDCLDARYNDLPVNFSQGMPLGATPMYRDALGILELETLARQPSSPGRPGITRDALLALLRSPFIQLLSPGDASGPPPGARAMLRLVEAVMDLQSDPIDLVDLRHLVERMAPNTVLAARLLELRGFTQHGSVRTRLPSQWSLVFRESLSAWRWPGRAAMDSIEYQQFERFEDSLDLLDRLDGVLGAIGDAQAVAAWRACLDDMVFQPKTADASVQVLGALEAAGLSFDALWVVGAQATTLPAPGPNQPFLPSLLRTQYALPGTDPQAGLADAWRQVEEWRSLSGAVTVSCHREAEDVLSLPSPLLGTLQSVFPCDDASTDPDDAPGGDGNAVLLEWAPDGVMPRLSAPDAIEGGAMLLRDQSQCPFRASVRHRIKPTAMASTAFGLTPGERGALVHEALHVIWSRLGGSDALEDILDALVEGSTSLVSDAVSQALATLESRYRARGTSLRRRVGGACLALEEGRVTDLLGEWLAAEAQRTVAFTVAQQEEEHRLDLGYLTLALRPDRIDCLPDGRRLVIDYKTGSVTKSHWLQDRPGDPQLPLYALLDDRVEGIAFAQLKSGDLGFQGLGEALGLGGRETPLSKQLNRGATQGIEDWPRLVEWWRERITNLAREVANGRAAVEPQAYACRYCEYAAVCRIDEIVQSDNAGAAPASRGETEASRS